MGWLTVGFRERAGKKEQTEQQVEQNHHLMGVMRACLLGAQMRGGGG